MKENARTARIAGGLYLLSSVTAGLPLIYVPSVFVVPGNATESASRTLASETAFRACIAGELIGAVVFIFTVRDLYRLLSRVNKIQASLMASFVLLSVPITFVNVLNEIAALTLVHGETFFSPFDRSQRTALAMMFVGLHGDGVHLANIFWGLWLFPFGMLVMKSGFLPRVLGIVLILNGIALVGVSFTWLLLPAYLDWVSRLAIVPELGELSVMVWLLVKGVSEPLTSADSRR